MMGEEEGHGAEGRQGIMISNLILSLDPQGFTEGEPPRGQVLTQSVRSLTDCIDEVPKMLTLRLRGPQGGRGGQGREGRVGS